MANYCSQCGKLLTANASFCNQCGASTVNAPRVPKEIIAEVNLQDKRAKIMGGQLQPKEKSLKKWVILGVIGLAIVWVYVNLPSTINKVIASQPVVAAATLYPAGNKEMEEITPKVEGDKIILPFDVLQKNKLVRFTFNDKNAPVPLLAYITNEGKIVTAISICEPCNSKQFHMKNETIVCNSCGTTWNLNTLEAISGSCGKFPPDAIPNVLVGNEIQIDKSIVQSWRRRG